jgi:hypothetical protein
MKKKKKKKKILNLSIIPKDNKMVTSVGTASKECLSITNS